MYGTWIWQSSLQIQSHWMSPFKFERKTWMDSHTLAKLV
jgi:hypothetical protein